VCVCVYVYVCACVRVPQIERVNIVRRAHHLHQFRNVSMCDRERESEIERERVSQCVLCVCVFSCVCVCVCVFSYFWRVLKCVAQIEHVNIAWCADHLYQFRTVCVYV